MYLNSKVSALNGRSSPKGSVGVEIEMEGSPGVHKVTGWRAEGDSSLRGPGAIEYVLSRPLDPDDAKTAVSKLYAAIHESGGRIDDSMRAGVHIHLNFNDNTMREVYTFIAMYYCFEDLINRRFGEDRVGNLFCLGMLHADYLNQAIEASLQSSEFQHLNNDNIRYGALNMTSLAKYGSLEFRAQKTPVKSGAAINSWIDLLVQMKEASLQFKTPIDVINGLSADGHAELAGKIFSKKDLAEITGYDDFEQSISESIRSIQLWVYSTKW